MNRINFSNRFTQIAVLALLALLWGSSFILMKRGLLAYSAEQVALYRIFIVFVVMSPNAIKNLSLLRKKTGWIYLLVGILGSAIPYFLFVKAQTEISSSLSGILNSLTPIFALLVAVIGFQQRFKVNSLIGIAVGFLGAFGLMYFSNEFEVNHSFTLYMLLPVIASAFYGININIVKNYLQNINPLVITSMSFIIIGPISGLLLFLGTDFAHQTAYHPSAVESLAAISVLGILGTAIAIILFNALVQHSSVLFASSVTYLIPIVAIGWGVLDGESFSSVQGIFAVLILVGISLINRKRRRS
ncbi:MAG TPA: EamA family transporter [Flavobacteriales bacterium]|nr:EamA family transporter [Flavobacteriales bacterium]